MRNELTIKIVGEAGQGLQTVGMCLCKLCKLSGLHVFANQDYMSRVRGGINFFQTRVAQAPLYTLRKESDIIIALHKDGVAASRNTLGPKGIVILDEKKFALNAQDPAFLDIPFFAIADERGGSALFVSSVAFGIISSLIGMDSKNMERVVKEIFSDKPKDVIEKNISAAEGGYAQVKKSFTHDTFLLKESQPPLSLLLNGNDAIALGAIKAGCKFYTAYPMTPSTSIMDTIAHYAHDFDIVVEQAEDEIAAVNMAIGASFAGTRSLCATSGGGFALMQEGISLAGMTETPLVVIDAQRPAPATGFPTRTEQADLDFLIHAGHGEFAKVVYAPGTIEEAFYLSQKAFNVAEKFQIPVLIMTDQHLADSYRTLKGLEQEKVKVERAIIAKEESARIVEYKRYQLTPSGISPRAIPGWIQGVVYADSDEHTEEGHITEEAVVRVQMVEKRLHKKSSVLSQEIEPPSSFNLKDAQMLLVGFGSTYGVMREACETLRNRKIGFVHLSQVWPFPGREMVSLLANAKKIVTVENNASGQLARLLRRETGILAGSILKFDGRPFDVDGLLMRIEELFKGQ